MDFVYNILAPQKISISELYEHYMAMDNAYVVKLSDRVDIKAYTSKVYNNAYLFTARSAGKLIGVVAIYYNLSPDYSFCTDVSVLPEYQGRYKIGRTLVKESISFVRENGSAGVHLYADSYLEPFYEKMGFVTISKNQLSGECHMLIKF